MLTTVTMVLAQLVSLLSLFLVCKSAVNVRQRRRSMQLFSSDIRMHRDKAGGHLGEMCGGCAGLSDSPGKAGVGAPSQVGTGLGGY